MVDADTVIIEFTNNLCVIVHHFFEASLRHLRY